MKNRFTMLLSFLLMLTACASTNLDNGSEAGIPAASVAAAVSEPELPKAVEFLLPDSVRTTLSESLEGARLLTISPEGKELSRISFLGEDYSAGQLSPDGRYLLCKTDAESGGEARMCGYSLVDLKTGKETSFDGTQYGFQSHMLLDDDLIGHTTSGRIGGVPEPKNNVSFYDFSYRLLEMTLRYDSGEAIPSHGAPDETYPEITATGLGYDQKAKRFYLMLAKDLSHLEGARRPDLPYSKSQMGIALFAREGELLETVWIEGYQAPFSSNVLCLIDNNPLVLPDGRLLLYAQNAARDKYDQPPLLFDPQTLAYEEVAGLAYGYQPTSRDGRYLRVNADGENKLVDLVRLADAGGFETVRSWTRENAPQQILTDGEHTFLIRNIWLDGGSYDELFYFDGDKETSILQLPNYFYTAIGIDREGNLLLLLDGASKEGQARESIVEQVEMKKVAQ